MLLGSETCSMYGRTRPRGQTGPLLATALMCLSVASCFGNLRNADATSDGSAPSSGGKGGSAGDIEGTASGGAGGTASSGGAGVSDASPPEAPVVAPPRTDASADTTVIVVPPDADPTCASCVLGRTECAESGLKTCITLASGCTGWSAPSACAVPQICPLGKTQCECPQSNACPAEKATRCATGNAFQTCNRDGICLSWTAPAGCPGSQTCPSGGAKCECPKICDKGAKQCGPGGGVETCSLKDGCYAWTAEAACAAPPNGAATCKGVGTCEATCNQGALACMGGTTTQCEKALWDFEGAKTDGFRVTAGVAALSINTTTVHGGKASLAAALDVQGGTSEIKIEKSICESASLNPVGKRIASWVRFDGPAFPDTVRCYMSIAGAGTDRLTACGDPACNADGIWMMKPGEWTQVFSYFPEKLYTASWKGAPISFRLQCDFSFTMDGSGPPTWTGNMFVDDVTLE